MPWVCRGYAVGMQGMGPGRSRLRGEPRASFPPFGVPLLLGSALTGDFVGAIRDFEAFVAYTSNARARAQRQGWIDALRAGENPFTPEVLEALRRQ